MAKTNLEERVTNLEAELAQLRASASRAVAPDAWKLGIEKYSGDADLQAVFRAAKKLRTEERKRVNSRPRKRRAPE